MPKPVKNGPGYAPDKPAPEINQDDGEPCMGTLEGTIQGTVTGRVTMDRCCCCKLVSETQIIDTGPISDADLVLLLQATVTSYETSGYLILAHSLLDVGGSRVIGLTVAWYV